MFCLEFGYCFVYILKPTGRETGIHIDIDIVINQNCEVQWNKNSSDLVSCYYG